MEPEQELKPTGQKEAVLKIIQELTINMDVTAETPLKALISKEMKKELKERLFAGIRNGSISCRKQYDDKALNKYCSGLISNWFKKDKALN